MLEKFRFTIGMAYARFHFRRKKDHAVNFTDILTRAHRVLVIFPEKEFDADSASTVLRYLLRRFSARGILVLIRNDFLHVLSSAPPVKTLVYTKEDVSRWFIPKTDVITRLASNTFDAAVDLNVSLSLAGAFLCKASNAPLRISFTKPEGDFFYNFQVQLKESSNMVSTLRNFLKCLDMF
jgi:hypothetical protein